MSDEESKNLAQNTEGERNHEDYLYVYGVVITNRGEKPSFRP